ncbi:MAG: HlyD family efflux transporter periplasmic adaptor subunit [Oscillospiraceae bacterium]
MAIETVSAPEAAPATAPASVQPPKKKKMNKKQRIKTIVGASIAAVVVIVGAFLVWKFAFSDSKASGNILTDFATRGTITNKVTGSGFARANKSATITLGAAGIVQEVFVKPGQMVQQGDPLFVIQSAAAEEALLAARESLQKQQEGMVTMNKELATLEQSRADLTVKAPHAGKLTEVSATVVGDHLTSGTKIGVLVDDTRLKLSLYYSYAFENAFKVGQTVDISVPSAMTTLRGTVEAVNKVERIVPEGGKTFEVVFVVKNPGTMTAGMAATASAKTADGTQILPYESGTFAYYKTTTISAKTDGPVEQVKGLMNYAAMTEGQVILVQGTQDIETKLTAKREQVAAANKTLEDAAKKVTDAQKALADFSAVAPMSGTVVDCALMAGNEVASGLQAITISDNAIMTIDIKVDERNVKYVKAGMNIEFQGYDGGSYMGTVDSIAVVGKNENGVTTYPAVVKVDNAGGTLMAGMGLEYSFVAAESMDCIIIPLQCVKTLPGDVTAVWLKAPSKPENALELTEDIARDVPAGFYAVPVTLGLADNSNVEITEGLNEMDEIYTNVMPAGADGGMGGGMMVG